MKIKDIKELIKDLPDEMPFGLLDISTDDETEINYPISKDDFIEEDIYEEGDFDKPIGKGLFLTFDNYLREEVDEFRKAGDSD